MAAEGRSCLSHGSLSANIAPTGHNETLTSRRSTCRFPLPWRLVMDVGRLKDGTLKDLWFSEQPGKD